MLAPTTGSIEVAGGRPAATRAQLARVGFVAQDAPTYAALSVADHLRLGAHLNPRWDPELARDRIRALGLSPALKAGRLSGGQRAQLALTLALAKRPEVLILDEPVASLDPLARRDFLNDLAEATAEHQLSVVLSSHLVADLEQVCDFLIVLAAAHVRLAGDDPELLASIACSPRRSSNHRPTHPASTSSRSAMTVARPALWCRPTATRNDPAWTEMSFPSNRGGFLMPRPVGRRRSSRTRWVTSTPLSCAGVWCCRTRGTRPARRSALRPWW
jgi:ABC-2 type transport system ATP-binding protein